MVDLIPPRPPRGDNRFVDRERAASGLVKGERQTAEGGKGPTARRDPCGHYGGKRSVSTLKETFMLKGGKEEALKKT